MTHDSSDTNTHLPHSVSTPDTLNHHTEDTDAIAPLLESEVPALASVRPIHIVTDSGAHFPTPSIHNGRGLTIVPYRLTIGSKVYREGIDLGADEAIRLMAHQPYAPVITPPSTEQYLEVFERLARSGFDLVSIHTSREISSSWANARDAAAQLAGHCRIDVIDSQTLSTGQAMLVSRALRLVEAGTDFDEVVRDIRAAVERVYAIYYTETTDYLIQNKIMSPAHGILGSMLGIKPFIAVENGQLRVMEKVRTRIQAIERIVEFAAEFDDIEDAVILQHKPHHSDQTRMLHDRLAVDFPNRAFPSAVYGPFLAALIGSDATGLVILERITPINIEEED